MKKYYDNNHVKIKNYIQIIILFISLIQVITDDTEPSPDNTCSTCTYDKSSIYSAEGDCINCRPYHGNSKMYDCGANLKFYKIFENGTCINRDSNGCNLKVIHETGECVDKCPGDTWELGDYCYYNLGDTMKEEASIPFKTCKCKRKYNITKDIGQRTKYICRSDTDTDICESKYYDGDTNQCIEENDCSEKYKKYSENEIRCTKKCDKGEYTFTGNKTCAGNCNSYEYESLDGTKYCVAKCDDYIQNYYIKEEKICVSDCGNLDIRFTDGVKKCFNSSEITNLYKYNDIYFDNCGDTEGLLGKVTYNYTDNNNVYMCVEDCSSFNKYLGSNGCQDNCTSSSQNFFYKKLCLDVCDPSNYTMNLTYGGETIHVDPENKYPTINECLDKCPTETYIDDNYKQCFVASCPDNKFIDPNNKCIETCQNNFTFTKEETLKIEPASSNSNSGGRRLDGEAPADDPTYQEISVSRKYCLSSCPRESPYYDNNEKICYNTTCSDRKLYSSFDNPYICYESCYAINGTEYSFENNYICYKKQIVCDKPYIYIDDNGNEKCSTYAECKAAGFKYLKGKKCIKNCDPGDYSLPNGEELGECFSTPDDCVRKEFPFYKNSDRICKKECNDGYKTSLTNPIRNKNSDTCFSDPLDCPESHPKYDNNTKLCYETCPKYYLGNQCFDKCEDSPKPYHFDGDFECIEGCKKDGKFFYINDTNSKTCYNDCPPTQQFIEIKSDIQNKPYECIKECPSTTPYYYENKKVCRETCDVLFHSNNTDDDKLCVTECEANQAVYGKTCIDSCPGSAPLRARDKLSDLYNNIIVTKCVDKCPTKYHFISNSTNECLEDCPITESYKYKGYCYQKCPNGTFPDDVHKNCSDKGCPERYKYYEKNDATGDIECKMSCPPDKFGTINGGECLNKCPKDYNYIGGSNMCINNCSSYGGYYEKVENVTDGDDNYTIYKCVQSCGDKFSIFNEKECIDKCPDDYYTESMNNICYKSCDSSIEYPFSTKDSTGALVCAKKCHEDQPNFGTDKICKDSCSGTSGENITDYDGKCVSKCENPFYMYLEDWKCKSKCSDNKFLAKNNECVDSCSKPYYFIEGNECRDQCKQDHYMEPIENNNTEIIGYNCVTKCSSEYYYYENTNNKKCLKSCTDKNHFIIENTNICTSSCKSNYKKYYYDGANNNTLYKNNTCVSECPNDKPLIDQAQGKCTFECSGLTPFHLENSLNCITQCPTGTKDDNYVCKSTCPGKFVDTKKNKCVPNCDSGQYYVPGENICLDKCNETLYRVDGNQCVTHCNDSFFLIDENKCSESCPENKNYIVKIYAEEEENQNKIPYTCLDRCPDNYYYTNETILGQIIHVCKSKCAYKKKNTQICLDICPNNTYYDSKNGICEDNNEENKNFIKIIVNESDYYYYQYCDKCPNDYPYLDTQTHECVNSCSIIDYDNKTCVSDCKAKRFEDTENNNKITYCLSDCNTLGLFTHYETCVKRCNASEYLIENMDTKNCECQFLFYINGNKKICLSSETKECDKDSEYKVRIVGTNECTKEAGCIDGMLSLNGLYCYLTNGTSCPVNSQKEQKGNITQCTCINKYYKDSSSQIICLAEGEDCPSSFPVLKQKECIKKEDCTGDGNHLLNDLSLCLTNEQIGDGTSILNSYKFWYYNGTHYFFINQDDCPQGYQFLMNNSKQCVDECKDNIYYIEDRSSTPKKCVSSCQGSKIEEYEPKKYRCTCKNKWYENNSVVTCSENPNGDCSEFSSYNLLIKKTNQCVSTCPDNYLYQFNDECFSSCDEAKNDYGYNVKNSTDNSKCICENLWIKNDTNKAECISSKICPKDKYILINGTNECSDSCPNSNNLKLFNNICDENCPENTKQRDGINECECIGRWYDYFDQIYEKTFKHCLSGECPSELPYEDKTNSSKCIESCGNLLEFNYGCYQECPENTTKNETENKCECNHTFLWYQEINNEKKILHCNVESCPGYKQKISDTTNECLTLCNDNQYLYKDKCYDNNCPDNTRAVDDISRECIDIVAFDQANNSLSALEEIVNQNIKTIYSNSSQGGLVYNIKNSTLQIYGVNKNKKENKELIMRSNLTYIDLGNCIDKIYEKNPSLQNGDIIIVKYDLGDASNGLNINPVEFKLVNSKTGQEIPIKDACKDNSIIISYPLTALLNKLKGGKKKLRNLEEQNDVNNLSLREKFDKGKELNAENEEIDSFSINNIMYTNMCYPIEMNGKDLILEDRFNYLYPSQSFCESNCVYNKTDFVYERAICNCSPKDGINFQRTLALEPIATDDKEIKNKQEGSLLKCISKVKKIATFGFFYGLIIILVEIGMAVLTFLYSYRVFMMRIKKKFDIKGYENNFVNNIETENVENANLSTEQKYSKKKMDDFVRTSERDLDNPPKKTNNNTKLNVNDNKNKNNRSSKKNRKDKRQETKKTIMSNKEQDEQMQDVINVNKLKISNKNSENEEKLSSSNLDNDFYEKNSIESMKDMEDESIFELIKLEERLLRVDFNCALRKNKAEIVVIILTEILDKIYLFKAIFLLQKYEIFSLYFSLYLLWHFLLLSFLSLFYNNDTIHKIWIKENYPDLNYHLSFGFVVSLIVFVIYKGLSLLINNDKKIKELELYAKENKAEFNEKFKKMLFWAQIKIIIFYSVQLILLIIFYLYLITFFGIYTGTSSNLVESYGIALIEILLIKILYGIVLAVLRKISLSYRIQILYTIVVFLDTYIS